MLLAGAPSPPVTGLIAPLTGSKYCVAQPDGPVTTASESGPADASPPGISVEVEGASASLAEEHPATNAAGASAATASKNSAAPRGRPTFRAPTATTRR